MKYYYTCPYSPILFPPDTNGMFSFQLDILSFLKKQHKAQLVLTICGWVWYWSMANLPAATPQWRMILLLPEVINFKKTSQL